MSRKPPVTPSPHRFLAGKQKPHSPTKDARSGPGFRKDVPESALSAARDSAQFQSSRQFASTPRFSFAKPKAIHLEERSPSPPRPAVVQSFKAQARRSDQVEDSNDADEDEEMLDGYDSFVLPTTELESSTGDAHQQWTNDLAFSPKRRRLEEGHTIDQPQSPTFKRPGIPASESFRPTPLYMHHQLQSTQRSTISESATLHRPTFLRPSVEPQQESEPLPETFSPHRRGHKFVPGGMAATMQQWVLETGQAAVQSRRGQGYLKGEDYVIRVKVESFTGDGPFTVKARFLNGNEGYVMLSSGQSSASPEAHAIQTGCVVGIRAPTWEVELDGREWTVGVDWRVLSSLY